jgi:hypothetical protein
MSGVQGLTVYEVMDIAERNDIPIARDGLITISKNFRADMSRKYAQSHNRFHYQSTLLGRPAKVELQFTPQSRKLYTLSVSWGGPGVSKTGRFFSEVQTMLKDKYGQPSDTRRGAFFYEGFYIINPISYAILRGRSGGVQIHYFDKNCQKLLEKESADIKNVQQQEYMMKDSKKF